jgi:hypothetical protein
MENSRPLRPWQSILLVGCASGVVLSVLAAFSLAALGAHKREWLFWTVCLLVFFAILARAAWRIAVLANEENIVVTNLWRTHRLRWAAVERIDDAGAIWPGAAALVYAFTPLRIRTRDGRYVYVQASINDFDAATAYLRASSRHAHEIIWGFRLD